MSEAKDQTIALNVRLKPSESSAHPRATNYTNVGVAEGIAYVDFGFIKPAMLAALVFVASVSLINETAAHANITQPKHHMGHRLLPIAPCPANLLIIGIER